MAWDTDPIVATGAEFRRPDDTYEVGNGKIKNVSKWLLSWVSDKRTTDEAEFIFPTEANNLEQAVKRCLFQTGGMIINSYESDHEFPIHYIQWKHNDGYFESGVVEVHHLSSEKSSVILRRYYSDDEQEQALWERVVYNFFATLANDTLWFLEKVNQKEERFQNQGKKKRIEKRGQSRYSTDEKLKALNDWDTLDKLGVTLRNFLDSRFEEHVPTSTFHSWRRALRESGDYKDS